MSEKKTLRFSVIIPAYNATDTISNCLRALSAQTIPRNLYEIIVVDDGSTDGTGDVAEEAGADKVLRIQHQGPAGARNAGVRSAQSEIILFTDADCEPAPDWIEKLTAVFEDQDVVGAKGVYRTRQREWIARLVQLEYERRYERMARFPTIDFIDTYSAAYRRGVFLQYGGFDTAYPVPSAEDVDLAFRMARDGRKLIFVPDAVVFHRHPTSLRAYLTRKGRYGYWRALLYLRYPEKMGGDAHTDPMLKPQFLLTALAVIAAVGGLLWPVLWWGLALLLLAFLGTTLPFVKWAWKRDKVAALLWPPVNFLRVVVQGTGLVIGLLNYGLLTPLLPRLRGRKATLTSSKESGM